MSRNAVIPRSRFTGISAQQHEYLRAMAEPTQLKKRIAGDDGALEFSYPYELDKLLFLAIPPDDIRKSHDYLPHDMDELYQSDAVIPTDVRDKARASLIETLPGLQSVRIALGGLFDPCDRELHARVAAVTPDDPRAPDLGPLPSTNWAQLVIQGCVSEATVHTAFRSWALDQWAVVWRELWRVWPRPWLAMRWLVALLLRGPRAGLSTGHFGPHIGPIGDKQIDEWMGELSNAEWAVFRSWKRDNDIASPAPHMHGHWFAVRGSERHIGYPHRDPHDYRHKLFIVRGECAQQSVHVVDVLEYTGRGAMPEPYHLTSRTVFDTPDLLILDRMNGGTDKSSVLRQELEMLREHAQTDRAHFDQHLSPINPADLEETETRRKIAAIIASMSRDDAPELQVVRQANLDGSTDPRLYRPDMLQLYISHRPETHAGHRAFRNNHASIYHNPVQRLMAMSPVLNALGPHVCGTSQWPINVRSPEVFRSFGQWRWRYRQAEGFSTAVDL
jgi:hypothetical protein